MHSAVVCSQSDFFRTKITSWLDTRVNRTVDLTGHPLKSARYISDSLFLNILTHLYNSACSQRQ